MRNFPLDQSKPATCECRAEPRGGDSQRNKNCRPTEAVLGVGAPPGRYGADWGLRSHTARRPWGHAEPDAGPPERGLHPWRRAGMSHRKTGPWPEVRLSPTQVGSDSPPEGGLRGGGWGRPWKHGPQTPPTLGCHGRGIKRMDESEPCQLKRVGLRWKTTDPARRRKPSERKLKFKPQRRGGRDDEAAEERWR